MIAEAASEVRTLISSDRSIHATFRFDQMAENITDRVDNPAESGVDRYVGLEHLDPESLQIRRWGVPTDVEATKLRFQPGDIIFGRRRAYQRKVAVADFEGICSAHALVLRARPEVVSPELLPFFMQSETFFERALAISVGSLSPTINWRTLAAQVFVLPPLEEQRRIAGVLNAILDVVYASELIVETVNDLFFRILNSYFSPRTSGERSWSISRLDSVAQIRTGLAKGKRLAAGTFASVPYVRVANVQDGFLDLTEVKEIEVPKSDIERYRLHYGDVLMTEGGDADKLGRGTIWRGEIEVCLHQNHVFAVRIDNTGCL